MYNKLYLKKKLDYIHSNPVKSWIIDLPEDYVYHQQNIMCSMRKTVDYALHEHISGVVRDNTDHRQDVTIVQSAKPYCEQNREYSFYIGYHTHCGSFILFMANQLKNSFANCYIIQLVVGVITAPPYKLHQFLAYSRCYRRTSAKRYQFR